MTSSAGRLLADRGGAVEADVDGSRDEKVGVRACDCGVETDSARMPLIRESKVSTGLPESTSHASGNFRFAVPLGTLKSLSDCEICFQTPFGSIVT